MRRSALGLALLLTTACTSSEPVGVAPRVTVSRVRTLAPGMTRAVLVELLGEPLSARPWGANATLPFFAREVPLVHHSPTLWVLVRDGVVEEAQAEWSDLWHLDEQGLFVVRDGLRWKSPQFVNAFPQS